MADPSTVGENQPLLAETVYQVPPASAVVGPTATDCEAADTSAPSPSTSFHGALTREEVLAFANDPRNPQNWPSTFRWLIVCLLAFMAFTVTFTCISVVPFAGRIVDDLDGNKKRGDGKVGVGLASALLVTIWETGEAAGPLAVAPLSETASWGRARVLRAASGLFALATALTALAPNTTLLIIARGLTGVAVSTNVLNPAIIGDMFSPDQRGAAMSLIQLAPLIGGAIGPAIGGALADVWGWRSVLWFSTGLSVVCHLLVWTAFHETYAPAILSAGRRRQQQEAREELPDSQTKQTAVATYASLPCSSSSSSSTSEADATETAVTTSPSSSGLRHIWDAVLRPAALVTDSLVLLLLALYGAAIFSHFYVMSVSLPDILQVRYGLSSAATGTMFLVFSIGALVSVIICGRCLDPVYRYLTRTRGHLSPVDGVTRVGRPEFKLPLCMACGLLVPLTITAYGWSAELVLPLPCLLLAEGLLGATMTLTFIPLAAYVVDAFGLYAASAITCVMIMRCLFSTFLPLTVAPLVAALGYGWGFTVLAGICLIGTPVPFAVFVYGERWRQLSRYTRDMT
ncbi:hypothetical protein SEPCBS119000_000115 [Sporothrix epigloea]|uniref:Major facilitator superfamily (MFS) profile domain-containing protein n=1 Tax=Sporothrix epigloea TaxID=1892477 RepID=A0ABP0D6X9_9PEZI